MAPWSDKMRGRSTHRGANEDALTELDTSHQRAGRHRRPGHGRDVHRAHGLLEGAQDDLLAAAKATTTITATDDEAARQALFDLYGQRRSSGRPRRPSGEGNTDLLTELYNAQGSYAPGTVEQTDDQKAIAEQTKQREHFAAVSGLIDKTFGYVIRDDAVAQLRPGGRPRGHVRSRWQRPSDPIHPDVPAGRREPAAQVRSGRRGGSDEQRHRQLQRPDGQPAAGASGGRRDRRRHRLPGRTTSQQHEDGSVDSGRPQAHHRHLPAVGRAPERQLRRRHEQLDRHRLYGSSPVFNTVSVNAQYGSQIFPTALHLKRTSATAGGYCRATSDLIRIQPIGSTWPAPSRMATPARARA